MPIYEYACENCGYRFDALQKMNADPLTECPECGTPALKKLLSAPNFRLKGSGWYETDFKRDKQRNLVEGSEKKAAERGKDGAKGSDDAPRTAGADKDGKSESATAPKDSKDSKDSKSSSGGPGGDKSASI